MLIGEQTQDVYELSNLPKNQLWFWIGQNLEPEKPLFNMAMAITINGEVEHARFNDAFQHVLKRGDALRTIVTDDNGIPKRSVREHIDYQVELIDFSSEEDPQAAFDDWSGLRCQEIFNMGERMFDSVLTKLAQDKYIWYWCQHHLICDGWSTALVYNYIAEFYQASYEKNLDEMPEFPSFEDYAIREREYRHSDLHEQHRQYWEKELAEPLDTLRLYGKTAREHGTEEVVRITHDLGQRRTDSLKALAKEKPFRTLSEHMSVFQIVSTCLLAYLHRITGNETLGLGTLYHNRLQPVDKKTIGLFMEMSPLRVAISGDETFVELFRKLKRKSNEVMLNYRYAPGSQINNRSFDVAFNYNNAAYQAFNGMPINLKWLHAQAWQSHEPLTIQIHDFDNTGTFTIAYDFNCGLFDEALQSRIAEHFNKAIDAILSDPNQSIGEFDILTEEEKDKVFNVYRQRQTSEIPELCLHQLFEQQASKTPDAVAVYNKDMSLSYAELDQQSNQLARHLLELGVQLDDPVGLSMKKHPRMIVAMLAILKAGGGYVPIDPEYPQDRLTHMINDSKIKVLITQDELAPQLPAAHCQLVKIDTEWEAVANFDNSTLTQKITPKNLAYVIYTSGSTGLAKGVMIEHHSIVNYTLAARDSFNLSDADKVLQFASISFDTAGEEIYPTLITGASLSLADDDMIASASDFLEACEEQSISLIDLPTAFWHQLTAAMLEDGERLPESIHTVIIGGERAQPQIVANWLDSEYSKVRLLNTYGPTETTIVSTYCELTAQNTSRDCEAPIGQPVTNLYNFVLDKHLQPVPLGVMGELHTGGAGLARGYLGQPEMTADKFIPDPFSDNANARLYKTGDLVRFRKDGLLEYRDRVDDQVKVRGFRIELGEVESALMSVSDIEQGVVVVKEGVEGEKRLVAYFVPMSGAGLTTTEIRNALMQQLPDYMIPQHFVELEEIPMTQNGKVNKKELPEPVSDYGYDEEDFEAPTTDTEIQIAEVWKKALKINQVGKYDNFFDIGGDSLLMMQVVSELKRSLGFKATPRMLVDQDLSQIANNFEGDTASAADTSKTKTKKTNGGNIFTRLFRRREKI